MQEGGKTKIAFILATPSDAPLFSFGINFYSLLFIEQNSRLISLLSTTLMIAFCIIAMMNSSELANRMKLRGS